MLIVTGKHNHTDSHVLKLFYRTWAVFLDHIRNCDNSQKFSISGEKKRCFSLLCKLFCSLIKVCGNLCLAADKFHTSAGQFVTAKYSGKSVSWKCLESGYFTCNKFLFLCFFENCFCQRMFAFFLQCTGKCEKFCFCDSLCRKNIGYFRLAACNGSGFIQCDDLDFSGFLKRNGCLEKNAVLGTHTVTDHNGNRCCKTKCTGAADNQHGNSSCQCITKRMPGKKPDNGCDHCNGDHCRYKHTGNTVCDLCNRCLGGCRVADHLDNLGKGGILSHSGCFTFDKSGLVHSCRGNHISGFFVHRNTLSGQRRFIDCSSSFQDHSIHRNILSRADSKSFSFLNLFDGNGKFLPVSYYNRSFWCQFHKAFQCIGSLTFGTGFQHFSYGDQCQDHGRGLKIEVHHVIHNCGRVSVYLCSCHGKQCIDTPQERCHGAKGYQSIHIGRTVPQALKSVDKEFLVDHHDDAGQEQLYQSHGYMIAVKPFRQRPSPHHMSHGKIHQHQQKSYRCDETSL